MSSSNSLDANSASTEFFLQLLAARVFFEALDKSTLIDIAEKLFKLDSDLTAAIELTESSLTRRDEKEVIERIFDDRGARFPSRECAGKSLAKFIMIKILDQEITPYQGANEIGIYLLTKEEYPLEFESLWQFAGLVSEYDDFGEPAHIEYYGDRRCMKERKAVKKKIVSACKKLLSDEEFLDACIQQKYLT